MLTEMFCQNNVSSYVHCAVKNMQNIVQSILFKQLKCSAKIMLVHDVQSRICNVHGQKSNDTL